jgi:hypothetical protein
MDKGKRLDISNSKLTNNSKVLTVTINSKDASNSKEAKMEILK